MRTAKQTNAIVSSLFPENVRSRIMEQAVTAASGGKIERLEGGNDERGASSSDPIADLFPYTTIMFLDIAGMLIVVLFYVLNFTNASDCPTQASRRGPANESRLRYSNCLSRYTGE